MERLKENEMAKANFKPGKKNERFLTFFRRIFSFAGTLLKPLQAGGKRLPRLWTFLTGGNAGGLVLYQQNFKDMEPAALLRTMWNLPGNQKARRGAGKNQVPCSPVPGIARINGSLIWIGKTQS
jgi:hypothetical protein